MIFHRYFRFFAVGCSVGVLAIGCYLLTIGATTLEILATWLFTIPVNLLITYLTWRYEPVTMTRDD